MVRTGGLNRAHGWISRRLDHSSGSSHSPCPDGTAAPICFRSLTKDLISAFMAASVLLIADGSPVGKITMFGGTGRFLCQHSRRATPYLMIAIRSATCRAHSTFAGGAMASAAHIYPYAMRFRTKAG